MRHRLFPTLLLAGALFAAGCAGSDPDSTSASSTTVIPRDPVDVVDYGPPPDVPDGPLGPGIADDLDLVFDSLQGVVDLAAIGRVAQSGDARVAWLFSDLLRFTQPGSEINNVAFNGWQSLTGRSITGDPVSRWNDATNRLIAWDTPAPPDYARWKGQLFVLVEPGWAPFFADTDSTIDWRWVSWGGVLIDDRPVNETRSPCARGCIPALDDPTLTDTAGGDWYPDEAVVFGVVVGDEAVAFPKNIMEVHEMVNMTIAGRRIGMPYCTLCGSAQAYFTDRVPDTVDLDGNDTLELRTSGLLNRSNKVMFELHTMSVFDTFTGVAVSGPLREAGVALEQLTVRVATWGDWKASHPDTRIVAEDGGIGRTYAADPLRGRDDDGPIFPIGDVDPRLGVQEPVIGVKLDDGTAIAFVTAAVEEALARGETVELGGVTIGTDGGGFTAVLDASGESVAAHQAFWFAWSQFNPGTGLWGADG
jgi:Protein of unknown function (DUF3179)